MFILKMEDVSRIMMGMFYVLNVALLAICKTSAYKMLTYYRQKGYNFRNILIIGSKERAKDVIGAMGEHLGSGYRIIGCLETDESQLGKKVKNDIKVFSKGPILFKQERCGLNGRRFMIYKFRSY